MQKWFCSVWFAFCFSSMPVRADSCGPIEPECFACPIAGDSFDNYVHEMEQRFHRNLPPSLSLEHDVTIKFFLKADGVMRDARVPKSSSADTNVEMACIDAAYCASPLPAPPVVRGPLPAPPMEMLLPPDFFGTGLYTYTFSARPAGRGTQHTAAIPRYYGHLVIPREILFRYPQQFTSAELEADSNKMRAAQTPSSDFLDKARFQWGLFYRLKPNATRTEIRQHAKLITQVYSTLWNEG